MATKLLAVVATIILASCTAEDICSEFQDNCNADRDHASSYSCMINCEKGAVGTDLCVASPGNSGACPDISGTTPPTNFNNMDGTKCKKTCQDDSANACAFYRHDFLQSTDTKICYLMTEDQCDDAGNGCIETDGCDSGAANCEGGGHVVEPEAFTCPSGASHTAGTIPNFNLHWNCQDVNNNYADHDITGNVDAPGNTRCTAKPDCFKAGEKQHYVYTCVKKVGGAEADGEWKWEDLSDGTVDPDLVITETGADEGKLKEATCNADDLQLSNYAAQIIRGMEILCVDAQIDSDGKVSAQNSCILICDGYPILNFYTKMAKWMYTMMDDPTSETSLPDEPTDVIYCHK